MRYAEVEDCDNARGCERCVKLTQKARSPRTVDGSGSWSTLEKQWQMICFCKRGL